jgi:outer membrane protein assembly factor BamB
MYKVLLLITLFALISCSTVKRNISKLDSPQKPNKSLTVSWIKNLDPVYNTGNFPIGTSSPFIFEDILYMGDLSGVMTAYDLDNGRAIWSKSEKQPIQSKVNKVGKNIFYGTKNGRFFSRHYLTGALNYSIDLGAPIESQPVFTQGRLIIHLRNHTIVSLDASTGKVFWRYRRSIPYTTTLQRVSKVLPFKNRLIVGFADGYLVSLSLEEGVVNWEQKLSTGLKFVDVDVRPLYFNGKIVAGSASGPMRFIDPSNGAISKTVELYQSHTPLVTGDSIVVGSVFGDIYRVDSYGKVVMKKNISSDGISSVVAWKNGLAVTTMGSKVLHLDSKNFSVLGSFDLGSEQSAVFGDMAISDEYLSIYSSRNRLYVFR